MKTTRGEFDRRIHISLGELVEMSRGPERYDLFRVYEVTDGEARLRIARDVKPFADRVLQTLAQLPQGVTVDSISVPPQQVGAWEAPIVLTLESDE